MQTIEQFEAAAGIYRILHVSYVEEYPLGWQNADRMEADHSEYARENGTDAISCYGTDFPRRVKVIVMNKHHGRT